MVDATTKALLINATSYLNHPLVKEITAWVDSIEVTPPAKGEFGYYLPKVQEYQERISKEIEIPFDRLWAEMVLDRVPLTEKDWWDRRDRKKAFAVADRLNIGHPERLTVCNFALTDSEIKEASELLSLDRKVFQNLQADIFKAFDKLDAGKTSRFFIPWNYKLTVYDQCMVLVGVIRKKGVGDHWEARRKKIFFIIDRDIEDKKDREFIKDLIDHVAQKKEVDHD